VSTVAVAQVCITDCAQLRSAVGAGRPGRARHQLGARGCRGGCSPRQPRPVGKDHGGPGTGPTVLRLPPTFGDVSRLFAQAGGSPSDSIRHRPTHRLRMACRRLEVRIPLARSDLHPGFPSNRGDFLIADSCNFAASSDYRTPVHFVPWAFAGTRGPVVTGRAAPWDGAGWGLPVFPA